MERFFQYDNLHRRVVNDVIRDTIENDEVSDAAIEELAGRTNPIFFLIAAVNQLTREIARKTDES